MDDTHTYGLSTRTLIKTFSCMVYASTLESIIALNYSFLHGTIIQSFPFYFRMYCTTLFAMGWLDVLANVIRSVKNNTIMNIEYFLLLGVVYPYCIFSSTDTFLALFGLQSSLFQEKIYLLLPSGIIVGTLLDWSGFLHHLSA
jgi:hypothetical protein